MSPQKSAQEEFLVEKMVARVRDLNRENGVFERKLAEPNLNDEDYDLYQGLMDRNIGEQIAYRRMEDNLREWRTDHAEKVETPPQEFNKEDYALPRKVESYIDELGNPRVKVNRAN